MKFGDPKYAAQYPRRGIFWDREEEYFLLRRYFRGMPLRRIAELLGRSTGAIRSRLEVITRRDKRPWME